MTKEERESVYDSEIAPVLRQAAEACMKYSMPFIASVEYAECEIGVTGIAGSKTSAAQFLAEAAVNARGNLDALFIKMLKYAKETGDDSSVFVRALSMALSEE